MTELVKNVQSKLDQFENDNKLIARKDYWVALRSYPIYRVPSLEKAKQLYSQLLDAIKIGDLHCEESDLSVWSISLNPIKID